MPAKIEMPQLSDTMTEGTVVKWKKKEGEAVRAGEEIAEVETDKATMPMEAYEGGTLAYIAVPEGGKLQVGGLLGVIAKAGENPVDVKKQFSGGAGAAAGKAVVVAAQASTAPHDRSFAGASSGEMHEGATDSHVASRGAGGATAQADASGDNGRIRVSPLAKRMASENGIDLASVQGSGPGGRIVQKDVAEKIARKASEPAAATPVENVAGAKPEAQGRPLASIVTSGQTRVLPMTKLRTAIAAALQRSKQQIPHFYETIDVDVEELARLRERLNGRLEKEKVRLSIADFIARAVASALTKHPALNARYNADKGEIVQYGDVNLGMAVAISDGLIVPVLRGANQLGLKEIRVRSADLIERARAQRLRREELSEGTFTISSLGTLGIREFSAIINPPEVAILAVGAAERRAVVRGDAIVARTMMSLTLSCDHRAVDGATAAEFLHTLKATLEEPGLMLV